MKLWVVLALALRGYCVDEHAALLRGGLEAKGPNHASAGAKELLFAAVDTCAELRTENEELRVQLEEAAGPAAIVGNVTFSMTGDVEDGVRDALASAIATVAGVSKDDVAMLETTMLDISTDGTARRRLNQGLDYRNWHLVKYQILGSGPLVEAVNRILESTTLEEFRKAVREEVDNLYDIFIVSWGSRILGPWLWKEWLWEQFIGYERRVRELEAELRKTPRPTPGPTTAQPTAPTADPTAKPTPQPTRGRSTAAPTALRPTCSCLTTVDLMAGDLTADYEVSTPNTCVNVVGDNTGYGIRGPFSSCLTVTVQPEGRIRFVGVSGPDATVSVNAGGKADLISIEPKSWKPPYQVLDPPADYAQITNDGTVGYIFAGANYATLTNNLGGDVGLIDVGGGGLGFGGDYSKIINHGKVSQIGINKDGFLTDIVNYGELDVVQVFGTEAKITNDGEVFQINVNRDAFGAEITNTNQVDEILVSAAGAKIKNAGTTRPGASTQCGFSGEVGVRAIESEITVSWPGSACIKAPLFFRDAVAVVDGEALTVKCYGSDLVVPPGYWDRCRD